MPLLKGNLSLLCLALVGLVFSLRGGSRRASVQVLGNSETARVGWPCLDNVGESGSRCAGRSARQALMRMHVGVAPGGQAFNPFSSRSRNTKIKWFEADLEAFYRFIEEQPLLSAEEELQYGKALRMWIKAEKIREDLAVKKIKAASDAAASGAAAAAKLEIGGLAGGVLINPTQEAGREADTRAAKSDSFESDSFALSGGIAARKARNMAKLNYKTLVSDEELAGLLKCDIAALERMQRYYDIAREKLVNSNLKLVLAVVSRYRQSGIPNAELIAEGTRGLSRAALRYDYSKGFRFATYATWYVHQAVYEYNRWRKHPAKMPSRYLLMSRKIKDFQALFKESEGREPSTDEICDALEESRYDIYKVLTMQMTPVSINYAINARDSKQDGKERTYADFLATRGVDPTQKHDTSDLRQDMEVLMQHNLNEVERDVLRLRLGLDNGRPKAVKEIGKKFKISWKDVRAVEKEAMHKLRSAPELADFIDALASQ